jgi:hypothetical protein
MTKLFGSRTQRISWHCALLFALFVTSSALADAWQFRTAVANADAVLEWNAIALVTFNANGQNPFAQARYGAIVQLAVFEAVNAITGEYHPYLGTINAPQGASAEAAAIQAAYDVLITYFPSSASTPLILLTRKVLWPSFSRLLHYPPDGCRG